MDLMCSYAGFFCKFYVSQNAIEDFERFRKEFGAYYSFGEQENHPDVTIVLDKSEGHCLPDSLLGWNRIRIHGSHSKNKKYLLDGKVHTQKDAERYAYKKEDGSITKYYLEDTGSLVNVHNNSHIEIIGSEIYKDIVYIFETLLAANVEYRGGILLHAACCCIEDRGVIVCGHSGAGKTSLLFDLIINHNAKFHSNDRLILFPFPELIGYSVPIPVNVPIKTMLKMSKWMDHDVVKQAEDDTKIRFNVDQISLLFSGAMESYARIDSILVANYNSCEPYSTEISPNDIFNELEVLTPYDECHPKWLPLFERPESWYEESRKKFLSAIHNVNIRKVGGSSLIEALIKDGGIV